MNKKDAYQAARICKAGLLYFYSHATESGFLRTKAHL